MPPQASVAGNRTECAAVFSLILQGWEKLMTNSVEADKSGTIEVSGFDGLNLFDFIEADIPKNRWPARIRIGGISKSGLVAAKIHYIDIDGTDAESVHDYLNQNTELSVTEVDCEIDIIKLLATAKQLDVILPNTARLTKDHAMSVRG